jgi:hypothetical protein
VTHIGVTAVPMSDAGMRQEPAAGMGVQGVLMADARKQPESAAGVNLQGMTATDEGVRCAARVDTGVLQVWTAAAAHAKSAETPLMTVLPNLELPAPAMPFMATADAEKL